VLVDRRAVEALDALLEQARLLAGLDWEVEHAARMLGFTPDVRAEDRRRDIVLLFESGRQAPGPSLSIARGIGDFNGLARPTGSAAKALARRTH
jgi:hypothetical protein